MRSTIQKCRQPRLLAGPFLCAAFLLAANTAGACGLDWANVEWPTVTSSPPGPGPGPGPYTATFPMTAFGGAPCPPGLTVTITVSKPTSTNGIFTPAPAEDCPAAIDSDCDTNSFGSSHDLAVQFNPDPPRGASPVFITATFSSPFPNLRFEISDIDFSDADGASRLDRVVIDSNVGPPALSYKTPGGPESHTFSITGNTATAFCRPLPGFAGFPDCNEETDTTSATGPAPDAGTVRADFGALAVTTVTITYTEAGTSSDPTGRGVGFLANLTPVELLEFSIE